MDMMNPVVFTKSVNGVPAACATVNSIAAIVSVTDPVASGVSSSGLLEREATD